MRLTDSEILKLIDTAHSLFEDGATVAWRASETPIRTYAGWRHDPDLTYGGENAAFREAGLHPFWFLVEPKETRGADAIEVLVLSKLDSLSDEQWAELRSTGRASAR